MMKHSLLGFMFFSAPLALADEIWLPKTQEQIDLVQFEDLVKRGEVIVLGETHYDTEIVAVEANVVKLASEDRALTLGWEFLNIVDADRVASTTAAMKAGELSAEEGLENFFPKASAIEYKALFEAVASTNTTLIPTNLTREQKTPVTKNGIDGAEPGVVPPGFAMGSDSYFARFQEAMGPHPLPSPIENYFASQCLTDDIMAYSLAKDENPAKVLVTGSFHGDYRDAAVARLEARLPEAEVVYIKIVQKSDYAADELELLMNDPNYGPIADILYLVDTPLKETR